MDYLKGGLCPPSMTYLCFVIAWVIYSTISLNLFSAIYAIVTGALGVLALEFLCRTTNPIVSWVLLSLPLIYIVVVAAMFGYTYSLANMKIRVGDGCDGSWCMNGKVRHYI
jgi:hypothetical protein